MSAYLSDRHRFFTWSALTIGTCSIDDITPTEIRAYREVLQQRDPPAAPATINRR